MKMLTTFQHHNMLNQSRVLHIFYNRNHKIYIVKKNVVSLTPTLNLCISTKNNQNFWKTIILIHFEK